MVPVTRPQPEQRLILGSLTNDEQDVCFEEIFDYLTLKDLNAVGQTCKRLNRVAGKYFAENFSSTQVTIENVNGKMVHMIEEYVTNFGPFARYLIIVGDINLYRFAATNKYHYLKTIHFFENKTFSDEHYPCIVNMNILEKVSTVIIEFYSDAFRDNLLNLMLKSCANLQSLIIRHPMERVLSRHMVEDSKSDWVYQHCPKLEQLNIGTEKDLSQADLKKFLQANPQVKKLAAPVNEGLFSTIETVGMELDELETQNSSQNKFDRWTCDQIDALTEKGHIKNFRAKIKCSFEDVPSTINLKNIKCFTSLSIHSICPQLSPFSDPMELGSMVNLRKLDITYHEDIIPLSTLLTNIEELALSQYQLTFVVPFVRLSPKLKVIKIWNMWMWKKLAPSPDIIDVNAWNDDRTKLPNARKIQVFVYDNLYHEVRWRSVDMLCDMVEIRRLEREPEHQKYATDRAIHFSFLIH